MAQTWAKAPEIAEHTRHSLSQIKRLTRAGLIPHTRVGRSVLYSVDQVDQWLLDQQRNPAPAAVSDTPRRRRRIMQPTATNLGGV